MDRVHWSWQLGGTSTPTYSYPGDSGKETAMSWGLDAGYALLLGGRGRYLGVFAGLDAAYRYRHVGGVSGARKGLLPSGRMELRFDDRRPWILDGWYGDLARSMGSGLGVHVLIPVAEGNGLLLGWDRERFDARMTGLSDKDVVNIGIRTANILSVAFQFGF